MNEGVRDLVIEENSTFENCFAGLSFKSSSNFTVYEDNGDVVMEAPGDLGFIEISDPESEPSIGWTTHEADSDVDMEPPDDVVPPYFGWAANELSGDVDMEPSDDVMFLEFSDHDESNADGDFFTDPSGDVIMDDDFVPAEYSHHNSFDAHWDMYNDWDDL